MTTRPTPAQVDAALEAAGQYAQPPAFNPDDPLDVLAAEVRAQREWIRHLECEIEQGNAHCEQHLAELRAAQHALRLVIELEAALHAHLISIERGEP